ncbi:hypothetical protein ACFV4F_14545 [Kitasatospora sp. NPDC059722]|uniref:hypothetical protein n=1 Tax=Kitasatospora sp. NPDC059722 TaxID=3346925 RepID=UPI0036A03014
MPWTTAWTTRPRARPNSPAGLFGSPSPDESVRPFRTDPMGDEVDGMPTSEGGDGSILADLDRHMEGFGR